MKNILLFFGLLVTSIMPAQVVDSVNASTKLDVLGTKDGPTRLISAGKNGFILYGSERSTKTSSITFQFTTKNFLIYHYDSLFKETLVTVGLPFTTLDSYSYLNGDIAYFLVLPQMAGSKEAALIKYNLTTKTYVTTIVYDKWELRKGLQFKVAGQYLYLTYQEGQLYYMSSAHAAGAAPPPGAGDIAGESYSPLIAIYDLNQQPKVKPMDMKIDEVNSYYWRGARLISTQNSSDTVFFQLFYKKEKKADQSMSESINRIIGFYNGKMVMSVVNSISNFYLQNPYVIACDEKVNFFEYGKPGSFSGRRYSYSSSGNLNCCEVDPASSPCYPRVNSSVFFFRIDSLGGVKDQTVSVVQFLQNRILFDTSFAPFKNEEVSVQPIPNYILVNHNLSDEVHFIVSSWQILRSFEMTNGQIKLRYSLKLPLHIALSAKHTQLEEMDELMAKGSRTDLGSTFDIAQAYSDFYYVYSLSMKADTKTINLKLYKCRF